MSKYLFLFLLTTTLMIVNVLVFVFEPFEPKVGVIGEPHKERAIFVTTSIALIGASITSLTAWQKSKRK
ncbi:hypothetical protein [Paenibacillus sp. UNC496MF]|uniref:hypothetical protein n=1 Tax=Paenibacillus sp. UNC496MF TaxID=1502753 RepID=UPI0011604A64|nr:hypothetical protein [Paenibacillus sp. UNC496MF]